jgi:hypothetical protein
MSLKLYRISQAVNTGYDTYDSAVAVAESERAARRIHPDGTKWNEDLGEWGTAVGIGSWGWCAPEHVKVEFVGIPDERFHAGDVVCASFNAG